MRSWIAACRRHIAMQRARTRLVSPMIRDSRGTFFAPGIQFPELKAMDALPAPTLAPYEKLAPIWDAVCRPTLPDYPGFLATVAELRGLELDFVLDLACGTGALTARLAAVAPVVAGLDASEAMLTVARDNAPPGVAFHRADFRAFDLGRRFAAVVCASNSLNYVRDAGDLAAVFRSVARHLVPGGLFAFDTTTSAGMRWLSGRYLHHPNAGGERVVLRFRYDAVARRETATVLLVAGVERHDRVPLDLADIAPAAAAAGLEVADHFGAWWDVLGSTRFYVLANPG